MVQLKPSKLCRHGFVINPPPGTYRCINCEVERLRTIESAAQDIAQRTYVDDEGIIAHVPFSKLYALRKALYGSDENIIAALEDAMSKWELGVRVEPDPELGPVEQRPPARAHRLTSGKAAVTAPDTLGAAWREAEAALPEGWRLYGVQWSGDEAWSMPTWRAWAGLIPYAKDDNPYHASVGPTPAAALLALAAKLREAKW